MGLDMYAYAAVDEHHYDKYWEDGHWENNTDNGSEFLSTVTKPKELAYWRKHPNLHGWFRAEWESLGNTGDFNGDQLEITWDMLERLEYDVKNGELPATSGFFFGNNSDADYYEQDLQFIKDARAELFLGLRVFYNSSW